MICGTVKNYFLSFELSGLPRTTNGSHGHWRARNGRAKVWKKRVFSEGWPRRPKEPLKFARITLIRCSSSEPDYDNLVISFKPILDGLKQAGVISDDKRANIGRPEYLWQPASPGKGKIIVRVESTDKQELAERGAMCT